MADYHMATGSGNIKVKAVGGSERIDMSTGSGSVKLFLEEVKGMEATVRSGSGSIKIGWDKEEEQKGMNGNYSYCISSCIVMCTTGSGSIKIYGSQGSLV